MDPKVAWDTIINIVDEAPLSQMQCGQLNDLYEAATGLAGWLRHGGFFDTVVLTNGLFEGHGLLNFLDGLVTQITIQKEWAA